MNTRKDNNFLSANQKKKNRCWKVSQRHKNTTFLSTLLSFISLSKRKLNTATWKEKPPKILIRSATQPQNDKHLFLIPIYLFSSKKKFRIFFSKIPKFCGKKPNFSQCSTYVERQKYFRRLRFQASRRLKTRRQILMSSINMH